MARADPARRPRRLDLLQPAGDHPDRAAHRADADARGHLDRVLDRGRGAARRARGLEGRHLDRPPRDAVRGRGLLVPGLRAGLCADLRVLDRLADLPDPGLPQPVRGFRRLPAPHRAADLGDLDHLHRADHPHHARERDRGAGRGLHPHRARQGADRAAGAVPPRAAQRRGADRDRDRAQPGDPDRQRHRHRIRVQHPGRRPAGGRRGAQARLPGDPGPRDRPLLHLHHHQPDHRHRLCDARSEDPLLSEATDRAPGLGIGAAVTSARRSLVARYPLAAAGAVIVVLIVLAAVFAPFLGTADPLALNPMQRLRPPSEANWLGTDQFGRDLWTRVVYGTRVSLTVGVCVAVLSVAIGLVIGLVAGYIRLLDAIVMRVMDGLMAIPDILLAIALVSLSGASLTTVIIAITIPSVPRVVRLVRSVVLSVREEPYVEAAVAVGTPLPKILIRHVLPNCVPPLIVQATYVCAFAMLTEAILSFLGAGTPPEIPSWGNMMAEGRMFFPIAPRIVLFPGVALALTILAVNVLGDGLRDRLDPKLAKRV
ncbi:MAG: hypothetical protein C3F17_21130 [Bradyrhizobiaceae bacterium]|nr:MAG: hypothetical protein C3F17_21130 [Bradyrhizobiaceae bacterium]